MSTIMDHHSLTSSIQWLRVTLHLDPFLSFLSFVPYCLRWRSSLCQLTMTIQEPWSQRSMAMLVRRASRASLSLPLEQDGTVKQSIFWLRWDSVLGSATSGGFHICAIKMEEVSAIQYTIHYIYSITPNSEWVVSIVITGQVCDERENIIIGLNHNVYTHSINYPF